MHTCSSHVIICLGRVVPVSTKIEKLAMISEGGFELEYRQHYPRLFFLHSLTRPQDKSFPPPTLSPTNGLYFLLSNRPQSFSAVLIFLSCINFVIFIFNSLTLTMSTMARFFQYSYRLLSCTYSKICPFKQRLPFKSARCFKTNTIV